MIKKQLLIIFIAIISLNVFAQKNTDASIKDTVITDDEVTAIIKDISDDKYEGRGFGTEGIEKAAVYIENFLKQNNIKPFFSSYRDSFKVNETDGYNIVGFIEGTDEKLQDEIVILSAHYDHVGIKRNHKPDSIRNGANDNASGVSAVLNIAKLISDNNWNKRSIVVVLFSGEEIGLKGSTSFAKQQRDSIKLFYCGVNIDMIGSVLTDKPGRFYLSGETRSNIRDVFNKHIGSDEVAHAKIKGGYYDVFRLSDNYPLYKYLNIPAHTFCTFDFKNYDHYHKVSDEIENVDLKNTAIIIRKIAKGLIGVINNDTKEIVLIEEK